MHYRRVYVPNGTYFFTVNLCNRKNPLLIKHIDILRTSFRQCMKKHPFKIDGIVVMPDHLHLMMTLPKNDSDFSLRIRLIKSCFSYHMNDDERINLSRRQKGERGIWQRRFWEHCIRNEDDFEQHLNYIHYNPVKHNYVQQPSEWPYSSIHRYIKQGILPKNWACQSIGNFEQYGDFE